MELTKQEEQLLNRIIDSNDSHYMVWEAAYLLPSSALIAFGSLDGSMRSVFVGIGVIVVMRIITTLQQTKSLHILKSVCRKIANINMSCNDAPLRKDDMAPSSD